MKQTTNGSAVNEEVRTRTRSSVVSTSPLKGVTADIKALAQTVFLENKKMNAAKSNHDGARKNLYAYMASNRIAPFRFETLDENRKPVTLEVRVETPERPMISVDILRKLVKDDATFMKIVEASKKSVEEHVGSIVAVQATVIGKGTENVVVKPAK